MTTTTTEIEPIEVTVARIKADYKTLQISIRNIHQKNMADLEIDAKNATHNDYARYARIKRTVLEKLYSLVLDLHPLQNDIEIQARNAIEQLDNTANIFTEN